MAAKLPAKYLKARRALADCVSVDEVKDIRDRAIAMEVYATQAKDAGLISDATELRKRAERRIGELMAEEREAGNLKRGNPKQKVSKKPIATLKEQGVDKNLADRARKAAAMPKKEFEAEVAQAKALAVALIEGDKAIISAAKAKSHAKKKAVRDQREADLAEKIIALPDQRYGVIVADPEWKFEVWSEKGLDRAAGNHYATSELQVIKDRDVASIAADDCVLFLWATAPMLPEALGVMAAWGFEYRSHVVWVKDKAGTGYWFRNRHELLLVGTKGKVPAPAPGTQYQSALDVPVGKHSAKPDEFLEMIESYFPTVPKIELNRRGSAREGWDSWGAEAT